MKPKQIDPALLQRLFNNFYEYRIEFGETEALAIERAIEYVVMYINRLI